ncbi:hypothetical protein BV401_09375 [Streptomyces malaysiensis subsp. malaysiensis]|uniref:Uncharacterized protein n=1 Tax=Streptomyces autolyticus TaxID=75293 RepID=A0ABN4W0S8_9ACTN|nr:hypothetical protein BV401_09375 [Streptomyces autolyticus]
MLRASAPPCESELRGRGAVAGFLLGSIGFHVLGRATRPVVPVRQGSGRAHRPTGGDALVGPRTRPNGACREGHTHARRPPSTDIAIPVT